MNHYNLKIAKGLPVYFKTELRKDGTLLVNWANTTVSEIWDTLKLNDVFEVLEIVEQRPCDLDYGQKQQLIFQSVICKKIM